MEPAQVSEQYSHEKECTVKTIRLIMNARMAIRLLLSTQGYLVRNSNVKREIDLEMVPRKTASDH